MNIRIYAYMLCIILDNDIYIMGLKIGGVLFI